MPFGCVYGFREGHGVMVSRFWTIAMLRNAAAGLLLKPVGPIIAGPKRCSDKLQMVDSRQHVMCLVKDCAFCPFNLVGLLALLRQHISYCCQAYERKRFHDAIHAEVLDYRLEFAVYNENRHIKFNPFYFNFLLRVELSQS